MLLDDRGDGTGNYDAFVTELSPSAATLFSTYLGGSFSGITGGLYAVDPVPPVVDEGAEQRRRRHAGRRGHRHAYPHPHADRHPDRHRDAHRDGHAHPDAHPHGHVHRHADQHAGEALSLPINLALAVVTGGGDVEADAAVGAELANDVRAAEGVTSDAAAAGQAERTAGGNIFHYDKLNGGQGEFGPSQLQRRYPDTIFRFARRREPGPDITYIDGRHPSSYPGSPWPSGWRHGDFKPNTARGYKTFLEDINSGKFPSATV